MKRTLRPLMGAALAALLLAGATGAADLAPIRAEIEASRWDNALALVDTERQSGEGAAAAELDNLELTAALGSGDAARIAAASARILDNPGHPDRRVALCLTARHAATTDAGLACSRYLQVLKDYPDSTSQPEAAFGAATAMARMSPGEVAAVLENDRASAEQALAFGLLTAAGKKKDAALTRALLERMPPACRDASAPGALLAAAELLGREQPALATAALRTIVKEHRESGAYAGAAYQLTRRLSALASAPTGAEDLQSRWLHEALYSGGWTAIERKEDHRNGRTALELLLQTNAPEDMKDNARMLIGRASIRLGEMDAALVVYRQIVKERANTNHANEAQAEVVRILVETRRWEELKQEALTLADMPHPRGRAYGILSYVNACVAEGEDEMAVAFLEDAIAAAPGDPYAPYYGRRVESLRANCSGCN